MFFSKSIYATCFGACDTVADCMNTKNKKTESTTIQVGNIVNIGTPALINPKGKEWILNYISSLAAVLVEGPFQTKNDTLFRAIPIRFGVLPQSTDEVHLAYDAPTTCFLWMEFPVSREQLRLWNPTRPLKASEFQKLLTAREQYRRGLIGDDVIRPEIFAWRNRFLQRNRWVMLIADYRRTELDELYESRN